MLGWEQLDRLATQLGVTPLGKQSPDIEASTQGGLSMGHAHPSGLASLPGSAPGSARGSSTVGAPYGSGHYGSKQSGGADASRDAELKFRIMVRPYTGRALSFQPQICAMHDGRILNASSTARCIALSTDRSIGAC